jgi:hypothetical protein
VHSLGGWRWHDPAHQGDVRLACVLLQWDCPTCAAAHRHAAVHLAVTSMAQQICAVLSIHGCTRPSGIASCGGTTSAPPLTAPTAPTAGARPASFAGLKGMLGGPGAGSSRSRAPTGPSTLLGALATGGGRRAGPGDLQPDLKSVVNTATFNSSRLGRG